MNADDHALLERTRQANKMLSLFAFALQEDTAVPAKGLVGIATTLQALADTIQERAAQQGSHP